MSVRKKVLKDLERTVLRAKAFGITWLELVSILSEIWRKSLIHDEDEDTRTPKAGED